MLRRPCAPAGPGLTACAFAPPASFGAGAPQQPWLLQSYRGQENSSPSGDWAWARRCTVAGVGLFAVAAAKGSAPQRRRPGRRRTSRRAGSTLDNTALVFVKPHACTPEMLDLVPDFLQEHGVTVKRRGNVTAEKIATQGIIDAHYSSISRVAMEQDVSRLKLGAAQADRFEAAFGRSLAAEMSAGNVYSAASAVEAFSVSPGELLSRCLAAGYEKLGSGLYCARLKIGDRSGYVLNGFYARMREKFVADDVVVPWLVVHFDSDKLPWANFRHDVVGATNPSIAAEGSLRATVRDRWRDLGLESEADMQDNGVHASAGPLESLRERVIWAGEDPKTDPFGAALVESRGADSLLSLLDNPVVYMGSEYGRAFDLLEDVDTGEALEKLEACSIVGEAV